MGAEREPARVHAERDQLPRARAGRVDRAEPDEGEPDDAPAARGAADEWRRRRDAHRYVRAERPARSRLRDRRGRRRPRARALAARRSVQHDRVGALSTIVVGGGIMGACTLYELARAGEDALLLEAGTFADPKAATARSGALVRTHYSNAEVVRMAVRSRAVYLEQPYYTRCGWLFLVDEDGAEPARRNREMQQREEALSDEVDPADFGVATEGVAYALYEPD